MDEQKIKHLTERTKGHPCFDADAAKKYARMHLPVAPKCNISCNYCNRKYDCSNESRPGVTSKVLTPQEAIEAVIKMKKIMPHLSTIGIAGPGDSLANPDKTFSVMEAISKRFPSMNLCLSTNGLMLPEYAKEISGFRISHVTVTVNAVSVETAAKVYRRVRYNKKSYYAQEGAGILLENQLKGLELLSQKNILTKVNFIYIPAINARESWKVFEKTKKYGADLFNIMPFIPVEKTPLENFTAPVPEEIALAKAAVMSSDSSANLMEHCRQCRSDACGLLEEEEFSQSGTVNNEKAVS